MAVLRKSMYRNAVDIGKAVVRDGKGARPWIQLLLKLDLALDFALHKSINTYPAFCLEPV